jgi:hypothetical protein
MIQAERERRKLPLRVIAEELTAIHGSHVSQQNVSNWIRKRVPDDVFHPTIAKWLGLTREELRAAFDDAAPDPFAGVPLLGKIANRKLGKWRFRSVPTAPYAMRIDTRVMEPGLPVGGRVLAAPARPVVGNEVIAHTADGLAWVGVWQGIGVRKGEDGKLQRYNGELVTLANVVAVHPILLSERIAARKPLTKM